MPSDRTLIRLMRARAEAEYASRNLRRTTPHPLFDDLNAINRVATILLNVEDQEVFLSQTYRDMIAPKPDDD